MTVFICGAGTGAVITRSDRGDLLRMELSQTGEESGALSAVKMLQVVFSREFFPKAKTAEPRTGATRLNYRVGMGRRGLALDALADAWTFSLNSVNCLFLFGFIKDGPHTSNPTLPRNCRISKRYLFKMIRS